MTIAKAVYWISTGLLCLFYAVGAFFYLTQRPMVEEGYAWLGFPAYLITLLAIAKIAAPLAILTRFSVRLSDLAYAGMFYHLLIAISAHLNKGDGGYPPAALALGLMVVSFLTQNAGRKVASANVPYAIGLRV